MQATPRLFLVFLEAAIMRRFSVLALSLLLLSSVFLGCSRTPQKQAGVTKDVIAVDPGIKVLPPKVDGKKVDGKKDDEPKPVEKVLPKPVIVDASKQVKYDAALGEALTALAGHDWKRAKTAYTIALDLAPDDASKAFVQAEIAGLDLRLAKDGAGKDIVKNIEIVLNDGKAEDAAKLARDALKEFGDGDTADALVQLILKAEAIKNAEKAEDKDGRFARFKKEGEAAIAERNLRAAAVAFEQALLTQADADLQKTCDDIRVKLDTYDAFRKKAAELRKDPLQIEGGIAALTEAANAWDTPQIRQEIDEAQTAKTTKRDTVGVVDFEVRNDIGVADGDSSIADELLPLLKPRFDPVERGQIKKVVGELQIGWTVNNDAKQQTQLGKTINARYLVVGSVHRLIGITIRARLVDTQTVLVVQTGKIIAANMEEALKQMPDLAQQLLMPDDAKMKADQVAQDAAPLVPVVPADAVVPPAPAKDAALGAVPLLVAAAPGFGNAKPDRPGWPSSNRRRRARSRRRRTLRTRHCAIGSWLRPSPWAMPFSVPGAIPMRRSNTRRGLVGRSGQFPT